MVDTFSILLTHGLMVIALWRMAHAPEIDAEDPPEPDQNPSGFFFDNHNNQRND